MYACHFLLSLFHILDNNTDVSVKCCHTSEGFKGSLYHVCCVEGLEVGAGKDVKREEADEPRVRRSSGVLRL